jgi:hypothetical protein
MPDSRGESKRLESEWEGLKLVVEKRPLQWQGFVYDPEECEVLYTVERPDADTAKLAVLDFAAVHTFGPTHDLRLELLVQMLVWEPS